MQLTLRYLLCGSKVYVPYRVMPSIFRLDKETADTKS